MITKGLTYVTATTKPKGVLTSENSSDSKQLKGIIPQQFQQKHQVENGLS